MNEPVERQGEAHDLTHWDCKERIAELKAQLAQVTQERDLWRKRASRAHGEADRWHKKLTESETRWEERVTNLRLKAQAVCDKAPTETGQGSEIRELRRALADQGASAE